MIGHNSGDRQRGNWIAMSRDVREHPIVGFNKDHPRSEFEAWYDLLCMANYKPSEVISRGYKVSLDIGQLMAARGWLAERWMWTERRVRSFMDQLERDGMVIWTNADATRVAKSGLTSGPTAGPSRGLTFSSPKHRLGSVVTICNYSKYQYLSEQIEAYTTGLTVGRSSDPSGDHNLTKETTQQQKRGHAPVGAAFPTPTKSVGASRGSRLPADWRLPDAWRDEAVRKYVISLAEVREQGERFRDYWVAIPGARGLKLDWQATWRNWISRDRALRAAPQQNTPTDLMWLDDPRQASRMPRDVWERVFNERLNGKWDSIFGSGPGGVRCKVPQWVIDEFHLDRYYDRLGKSTGVPSPWSHRSEKQGDLLS